jgi:O-antigen/teichoic acid export membrane protein
MWPSLFAYVLTLGTPFSYIYYIKKRPELSRQLSGAAIALSLSAGLIGSVIGYFIIPYSLRTYSHADVVLAQRLVFLAPAGLCSVTLTAQLQSAGSFRQYNLFRFFSPSSTLAILLLLLLMGHLTPTSAALAYLLASIPVLIWIALLVVKTCRPVFSDLLSTMSLLLKFGTRAWGADILGTVANQVDRVLVVGMLAPSAMGLYVVAQSLANLLSVIPNAAIPVILPRVAGKPVEEIVTITGAAVRFAGLLMCAAALPMFFGGTFMMRLVYGSKFAGAGAILPFLILESILDGLTAVLSQAFMASGFPGMMTFLQGCGVLTAIPLMYLLIPRFGVRGAAGALMLATLCRFLFVMVSYPFRLKTTPPNLLISWNEIVTFSRTRQMVAPIQDT